jgi:hypothetical protein
MAILALSRTDSESEMRPGRPGAARTFHLCDIIVLTLGSEPQTATKALDQLLASLARQGLAAVSFGDLVSSSR